jgi:Phage tail assembly chaperone proteins, E, or 41 or 14
MTEEMKRDPRDPAFEIPDEITYDLKKPFRKTASGDEMVTRITFRPPTVAEMKQIATRAKKDGDEAGGIFMLSLLNNDKLTDIDIGRMNFIDGQLCAELLQPFLGLKPLAAAEKD